MGWVNILEDNSFKRILKAFLMCIIAASASVGYVKLLNFITFGRF